MLKIFSPTDWDFGEEPADIIRMTRDGRLVGKDAQILTKRASEEFVDLAKRVKIAKDEVPIHVIAMGATEYYGANRNGDGFKEAALKKYHDTFEKKSKWYRDHKNKDPKKSYGVVKMSYYNPEMHRVELLVALNAEKSAAERNGGFVADRELEKLAKGQDLATSMSCFLDPNYPILVKDKGYVGIASVAVGDEVWTHNSRWRKVTELRRRSYTGDVYLFTINGLPLPIELTATHPMFAKQFVSKPGARKFRNSQAFDAAPVEWVEASKLQKDDRIAYAPLTKFTGYGSIDCRNLAMLLGYYIAEGSLSYNESVSGKKIPSTVNWSCNWADAAVREIPKICEELWSDVTLNIRPHARSSEACTLSLFSTAIAGFFARIVKTGCRGKVIPPEIFNSSEEIKLAFLGAWIDGDGFADAKGLHISTVSHNLALQGRDLLASIGIGASIYKIDHRNCANSGLPGSSVEYTLNISPCDVEKIDPYCDKARKATKITRTTRTKPSSLRLSDGGLGMYRIRCVTSRYVENVPVYNFEVEDDESYSAAGLVSHNCRIDHDICSSCGNKAKTRAQYCDEDSCIGPMGEKRGGCKQHLAKVAADGHLIHVDNPHPDFFDISHVFRPADRIAYGNIADYLEKSAADRIIGGAERAEIMGVGDPLYVKLASVRSPVAESFLRRAYALASIEDDITSRPVEFCRAFKTAFDRNQAFPLDGESLKALADRKILLPLDNFISSLGYRDVSSVKVAEQLPTIFNRLIARDDVTYLAAERRFSPSTGPVSAVKRAWADKFAADLSLEEQHVQRRIWRSAITDLQTPEFRKPNYKSASLASAREIKVAFDYALYQLGFLSQVDDDISGLTSQLCVIHNYS